MGEYAAAGAATVVDSVSLDQLDARYVLQSIQPTGSGDDVPLQAYIDACQAAGTTPSFVQSHGTFVLNNPITISGPVNWGNWTCTFQASSTFPIGSYLIQTPSGTSLSTVNWKGSFTLDCNQRAKGVALNQFSGFDWQGGFDCRSAKGNVMLVGDGIHTAYDFKHTGYFAFGSTTGPAGAGSVGIIVNATDCVFGTIQGGEVETGVVIYGQDCTLNDLHISNQYVLQGVLNFTQQGSRLFGPVFDGFNSVAHSSATGSNASSTITDSAISAYHQGLRVTGTNIPANSFVGATSLVAGTSFQLVNATGTAVNPTGAVSGITLMPCAVNSQGATMVNGGTATNLPVSNAQDNTFDCFVVGSINNTSRLWVTNFNLWGGGTTRFANAFVGMLSRAEWTGVQLENVVNMCATRSGIQSTSYLQTSAAATPSATSGTYGTLVTLGPNVYTTVAMQGLACLGFQIQPTGVVAGEVLTTSITLTLSNNGSATQIITHTAGSNSAINSGASNLIGLSNNGAYATGMTYKVQSSINSSAASCTVKLIGLDVG